MSLTEVKNNYHPECTGWVSTQDALPEYKELVLFILAPLTNKECFETHDMLLGCRAISPHPYSKDSFYSCSADKFYPVRDVCYWMYIPILPKNPDYIKEEDIKDENRVYKQW